MKPQPGTVADLIARYRMSPRVLRWAPATRKMNDAILADFAKKNGPAPVKALRRGDVIAMRDTMGDRPGAANNWLKCLRGLLDYAVDLEMIPVNVARTVKRLEPAHAEGFRQWRDDEIEAFLARHAPGSTPRLALLLMLCTGASRADVVKLGPGHVTAGRIRYRRQKTAKRAGPLIDVPILPALADELAQHPPRLTFLATAQGPRSCKSLTGSVAVWVAMAGLDAPDEYGRRLNCHGLRKAQGRRLAEAGCSPHEIMSWLGHEDVKQAQTYTKAYDRGRAADEAAAKLGATPSEGSVFRLVRR